MAFSSSATSCAVFAGSAILLFLSRAVLCDSWLAGWLVGWLVGSLGWFSLSGCYSREKDSSLHTGALTRVLVRRLTHNDRRRSSKCARYVPRNERGITDSPEVSANSPRELSRDVTLLCLQACSENVEVAKRVSDTVKAHTHQAMATTLMRRAVAQAARLACPARTVTSTSPKIPAAGGACAKHPPLA
jgi:hypothetical protein